MYIQLQVATAIIQYMCEGEVLHNEHYIMNIYTLYVSVAIQRIYVEVTMDIVVPDRN